MPPEPSGTKNSLSVNDNEWIIQNAYLPKPDAEFQGWPANFVTLAGANIAALGLLPSDITALSGA